MHCYLSPDHDSAEERTRHDEWVRSLPDHLREKERFFTGTIGSLRMERSQEAPTVTRLAALKRAAERDSVVRANNDPSFGFSQQVQNEKLLKFDSDMEKKMGWTCGLQGPQPGEEGYASSTDSFDTESETVHTMDEETIDIRIDQFEAMTTARQEREAEM